MSLNIANVKQFSLLSVPVEDLLDLSIQNCVTALDAKNFTAAGESLKDCLALAGTDEDKMERVRKAVPSSLKHQLFSLVMDQEVNFLFPLIDLKIPELNAAILDYASSEEIGEIIAYVLEKGALPESSLTRYLGEALFYGNVRKIRFLLRAGADPNKMHNNGKTFFEYALGMGRLDVVAAFFACARQKINQEKAVEYLVTKRKVDLNEIDMRVAKRTSPLSESVRILTPHVRTDRREILKKRLIDPFLHLHSSIKHLIAPIAFFAVKETVEDPQFTVLIHQDRQQSRAGLSVLGQYSHDSGLIELFVPKAQLMTDRELLEGVVELVTDKDVYKLSPENGTLVHEMAHKAYDKIGKEKREKIEHFKDDVLNCVQRLSKDVELEIRELLSPIPTYFLSQQFEECLVRTPQIFFTLAKNHPEKSAEEIEQIVKKHIPELYKVYTEQFLPEIIAYNIN